MKIICAVLIGLSSNSFNPVAKASEVNAPASQPSRKRSEEYPKTTCNEWKSTQGYEGDCQVETPSTTWQIGYSREGKEDRKKTGTLRNLLVLFHGGGNNHKVREWWGSLLGPGKALDPNKWVILSIGTVGDGKPKAGSPIFLTADEILVAQNAVIDHIYPKTSFVLGGPSTGGQNAILWAAKFPSRVKKLILVSAHGLKLPAEDAVLELIGSLPTAEQKHGPYNLWDETRKLEWWMPIAQGYVNITYTDSYFRDPQWMIEQGWKSQDYKSADEFKKDVTLMWASYFKDTTDPTWFWAQMAALQTSDEKDAIEMASKLPEDVLMVWNALDEDYTRTDIRRYINILKLKKKSVREVEFTDARGHMACISPEVPSQINKAIRDFLDR